MRVYGTAVIVPMRGCILGISRGHDTGDWTLPGGKLDVLPSGRLERFEEAAVRELREETGVVVHEEQLEPTLRGPTRSGGEHVIYLARGCFWLPPVLISEPFEGYVKWLPPSALLAPTCTYRDSNRRALRRAELL